MKEAITNSLIRLFRPLVRILLKNNIPYGTFSEIAKWVYVDVASENCAIPGRKQTVSRIAIITGLSRKETARVKNMLVHKELGDTERTHRAVRVINGWRKDPLFLDVEGSTKDLAIEGRADSFAALVKKYSGDIPHRAILDEMVRAGVVEVSEGKTRLLAEGYIVDKDEIEKIKILGTDSGEFISTIAHNISSDKDDLFFQRKVSYDNIPEESLPEVKKSITAMSRKYIKSVDRLIAQFDKDTNPSVRGQGSRKSGLGIYYFE